MPHPLAVHHLGAQDPRAPFGAQHGAAPRPPTGTRHHLWGRSGCRAGSLASVLTKQFPWKQARFRLQRLAIYLFIYFIRWRASDPRAAPQQENPCRRRGINPGWDEGLWGPGEGCVRIPGAPSSLIIPMPNETRGHQLFGCAGAPSPAPSAAQLSEAAPWKRGSLLFSFCLEYFNFFWLSACI